jgi:arylsulfatase A-like enzyme
MNIRVILWCFLEYTYQRKECKHLDYGGGKMKRTPNILFILSDQHRYDCVGYSKDYPVKTPNIDRIASEGMWFTNAYTPTPICCPARQALVNGRRAESFGALWNYDITLKTSCLGPEEYSWAREVKGFGYRTGYLGEWHVNESYDPTAYGFDEYIDSRKSYERYRLEKYPEGRPIGDWRGGEDNAALEDTRTHWLAKKTEELIERYEAESSPWLIRLNFQEPHLPCNPAEPFSKMYKPEDIPMWRSFPDKLINKPYIQKQQLINWKVENYTWQDWAPIAARYYGMISQVDDAIGKVLHKLDEMGLAEDTIVIFSSDHGDMCGGHRMVDKHYILYDDVVKVPLAIKWPGVIKEGAVCDKFVYNCLDLPPTILEMLGLESKEFFHGRSMLPLLKEESAADWRNEVVSTYNGQQFGLYTQRMIRNSRWKYIWNTTDVDELYDLEKDPGELNNLIHEEGCSEILAELRKKLYEELIRVQDGLVKTGSLRVQLLEGRKL